MADLNGRTALVTGGARGIGAAIARQLTEEAADTVWALNVRAPLLLAGAAAGHMAQRGAGSIINISSALAARGNGGTSLYAASKGAIDAATRALAAEWGPRGVRVNTVRPGVTRSDMTEPLVANEAVLATLLRSIPLGRVGDAEDIAAVVVFLAGDASAYLTGQILDGDGGWSATARSIRAAS